MKYAFINASATEVNPKASSAAWGVCISACKLVSRNSGVKPVMVVVDASRIGWEYKKRKAHPH